MVDHRTGFKTFTENFRYEMHNREKYFYENAEYLDETVDERKLNLTYIEILNEIENGKINPHNLGVKMYENLTF